MTTDDLSEINFDWTGASDGVLPDVSMSEPVSMQPTTATGNGTGYYVDNTWQAAILGTVNTALNYAIARDQADIAKKTGFTVAGTVTPTPATAAKLQNNRILLIGGIAVALAFVLRGK